MEEDFCGTASDGKVEAMKELLRSNPTLDVNWRNEDDGCTALYMACGNGHDAIASILLAHPDIDVNQKNVDGDTPFANVCAERLTSCVPLLLKDSRVSVLELNGFGSTPLCSAAFYGHLEVVKWWIASGREMDLGTPGDDKTDVIGAAAKVQFWEEEAQRRRKREAVTLLERFKENPGETRHATSLELGWYDEAAAEMFAMVVFVSDGLLEIREEKALGFFRKITPAARFFSIANRLPLELQMALCYRVADSAKEMIPGNEKELAFKLLANAIPPPLPLLSRAVSFMSWLLWL